MKIRYRFCLLLFFSFLFFSFLFGANQIVFRKPIIFLRDLYIGHYDISLLGDTSVNGGMESDGTINAVKVSINTDPANATSLTIGNNTDQLNILLQNIPVNQQLDTYLMYDPISFLVCSFKHDTPEPDDLKVDELVVSEIGGNMNSSLLINGVKGDIFIGNLTNKISCQAERIFFDADISSTQNKIMCASKTKVLELLKATNLISQNSNLAKTSLAGATIKASTVNIKNISTGDAGILIGIIQDGVPLDFEGIVSIDNSFSISPGSQGFRVFLETVPVVDNKNALITIDSNYQLYIFNPSTTSVAVPEIEANTLNVEAINTTGSYNTEVKGNALYLNSAKVAIGKQLLFSKRTYIKNNIVFQQKSDFNISVSVATLNLKNNLANPNATDVIIKATKDEGDYILLKINGFLQLNYGATEKKLGGYAFLVNGPGNILAKSTKVGDSRNCFLDEFFYQEEFSKYIIPKLFQYKKEYCDDHCLRLGKQRDRLGLLADDLVVLENEKLFDRVKITTKNQESQVIDYDERLLAEIMIQQIHFFYKKLELFQQKLKKHNESILTLVNKIKTVEKEIIEKEVFLNSLREDSHK